MRDIVIHTSICIIIIYFFSWHSVCFVFPYFPVFINYYRTTAIHKTKQNQKEKKIARKRKNIHTKQIRINCLRHKNEYTIKWYVMNSWYGCSPSIKWLKINECSALSTLYPCKRMRAESMGTKLCKPYQNCCEKAKNRSRIKRNPLWCITIKIIIIFIWSDIRTLYAFYYGFWWQFVHS